MAWLTTVLLPLCYWNSQVQRTDKPALNAYYQTAYQQAQRALLKHPITSTLDEQTYRDWAGWANEMVTKFHHTTAAVEGRNGYLTQIHHSRRRLSPHRLHVMTAIHNFDLQRADGSTAAERLFKQAHPDLFQTVLAQMPDLPLPRRGKQSPQSLQSSLSLVSRLKPIAVRLMIQREYRLFASQKQTPETYVYRWI